MKFVSYDVDRVQSTWKQFVPSAELQGVDPQRFRFDWRSSELGAATVVRYDLEAQVHSLAAPEDQLLVCRVDSPDARVWSGAHDLDPSLPWATDRREVQASWDRGATVSALVFDRTAAQARLRTITGVDDLVLRATDLRPKSRADAARWARVVDYVDAAAADETNPMLLAELERHALMMTVAAFATTFDESLRRPAQRSAAPQTVRRALDYIDAHAHRAITVDDIAAACFISTRGLQYAFRRALDASPADMLRRARLDGARRELLAGATTPIAEVARRWGFSHPSRFAAAYRAAFGEAPSVTSRRAQR
ncbi:AraC family transcriptional regulator [Streptomyces sp. AC495_CC817]|uniref:AraC family transcriptional regulator n=1 Tax=Streptomyces sp. AC495_CC817 TaxID=2823900 RepID=UPI001C26333C|nr:AraC family transcriptional regulator [Streptomyces sp. AC495_CC817]